MDDSLEVAVVAGHLVFRAHQLNTAVGMLRGVAVSRDRIDDGQWHEAFIRRSGRKLYCRYFHYFKEDYIH